MSERVLAVLAEVQDHIKYVLNIKNILIHCGENKFFSSMMLAILKRKKKVKHFLKNVKVENTSFSFLLMICAK